MITLLDALMRLQSDVQVNHYNQTLVVQAIERKVKPGWYQKDQRFYIHDTHNSAISSASGMLLHQDILFLRQNYQKYE